MTAEEGSAAYDRVPYEANSFAQSHPRRLQTIAHLYGLETKPIRQARVLELGCAQGGNLLPMASELTEAELVGIDYSAVQVADGRKVVDALGAKNVRIEQKSILDVDASFGEFDYIIAHGVYSWVPAEVRDKTLEICSKNLSANGVAYVSYNTLPGWRARQVARELMMYHVEHIDEPELRARAAKDVLKTFARIVPDKEVYARVLQKEAGILEGKEDSYLLHDHLEVDNHPVYFHRFAHDAQAQGLQFLAESSLSMMSADAFDAEGQRHLRTFAKDLLRHEQHIDFLRNRTFRQTLLCKSEVRLDRSLARARFTDLHLASAAKVEGGKEVDPKKSGEVAFVMPDKARLGTHDPILKAVMVHLAKAWPNAVPFEEALSAARARVGATGQDDDDALGLLRRILPAAFSIVDLYLEPPRFTDQISERPCAEPYARLQAARQLKVTSRRHIGIGIREIDQHLLADLDGTRTRDELVEALVVRVQRGVLTLTNNGKKVSDLPTIRSLCRTTVDERLKRLAGQALLIA